VVVGTTEGLARFDLDEGVKSAEMHESNGSLHGPYVRMNDGKCDPQGRLWLGSLSRAGPGNADLVTGGAALYVYSGWDCQPTRVVEGITVSNGLSWNAEGTTMYYTDSPTFHVDAFDFEGNAEEAVGLATNRRQAFQVCESFPPVPDGHALDTSGKLWVACFGVGEVRRYDPTTGEVLAVVKMPADAGPQSTACAFGGEALDELYITTAHEFWDAEQQQAHPLAGGLFKVPREELAKLGEAISGLPPHHFKM
jgi:sugar lactone lactonase YvrE